MPQVVFGKAVKTFLPSAIPTRLEKIDEYGVGKVLIYSKKPRRLIPMRKHELDFTGWSMQSLLAEKEVLTVTTARSYLFDTGKDIASKSFNVDIGGDLDLANALSKLASASGEVKFDTGENATLKVTTDFGKITHISTDLVNSAISKEIHLQPDHPIVKKAVQNGGVMFVISNIYEGERCNVNVNVTKDVKESASGGGGAEGAKADMNESVDDKHSSAVVVSRDIPTPLAYMLMKVTVDSNGIVTTQLNKRYTEHLEISHPYPTPSSEIATAKVTPPLGIAQPGTDEADGMPDEHYLYSLKDFQPFESTTYRGIFEETKQWLIPFVANAKLQSAFLDYTKLPGGYEKLNDLSAYFLDLGNAIRAGKPPPPNKLLHIDPIMAALTEAKEKRLDEISSVVIVAEAADEFPQYILKKILDLATDKRNILNELILQTPYGTSRHTYADPSPYKDPALKPILTRMGFSLIGTNSLTHTWKESDEEEDTMVSCLILLMASENK